MGGDQWNGMAVRFAEATTLNKPIITGEVGIVAGIGQSDCELAAACPLSVGQDVRPVRRGRQCLPRMELGPRSAWAVQHNTGPTDPSLLNAIASPLPR